MAVLSPSKIRTYERCPLQYKLQQEPWPDRPASSEPSPELAVDRAVHDALDLFHAEGVEGKDGGADRLIELLREGWPHEAFRTPADSASSLDLWQQRLTRYVGVESASAAKVVSSKQFLAGMVAGIVSAHAVGNRPQPKVDAIEIGILVQLTDAADMGRGAGHEVKSRHLNLPP